LAAGLRSCKITKIHLQKHSVLFEGRGYGHGIGMCQDGAKGMAQAGNSYQKILKHYYPGSKLISLTK
jgi:stage II sporulation protein D